MADAFQIGLDPFGDVTIGLDGTLQSQAQAREELWPHYQTVIKRIGGERGWPPVTRAQFEREASPEGALCAGSPATVAAKIVQTSRALGLSRFNLKYSAGTLPHGAPMKSIELIGTEVAPRVREAMGR
jgi:alkanesulfonate monooxygenase SsuD/methylene tetrahydromethanopterin reductase-like flavin-dependent oxidoreductase (luciferase family)